MTIEICTTLLNIGGVVLVLSVPTDMFGHFSSTLWALKTAENKRKQPSMP